MKFKLQSTLFASAAITLATTPSLATQEDQPVLLDTYQVTTNRYFQDASIVPATTLVLDREIIENSIAVSLPEVLLKQASNIQWRDYNGSSMTAQPSMHGYGENSQMRVLVLVDGVRQNRPDMGGINWAEMPVGSIENIEVISGAHSVIYGSNAVGGVIKITTRKPTAEAQGELSATYGSYDLIDVTAYGSQSFGNTGVSVSIEDFRTDGYRENSENHTKSANLAVYQTWKDWTLNARASYVDNYAEYAGSLSTDPFADGADPQASSSTDNVDSECYNIGADLVWDNKSNLSFETEAGYTYRDIDTISWGAYSGTKLKSYQLSPRFIIDSGKLKTVAGIDFRMDDVKSNIYTDETKTSTTQRTKLDQDSYGAYVHSSYTYSDQLIFSAGIRAEHNKLDADTTTESKSADKSDDGWAMNTGITFKPTENVRTWIRLDHFYRYPATDEVAYYSGYYAPVWFNPDLEPEEGWNIEIGGDWKPTQELTLSANAYRQDTDNEIAYNGMTSLNENLDETERYGLDLSARYDVGLFDIQASYSYVNAELTSGDYDGKDIPLVSPNVVTLRVGWKPINTVRIEAGYSYNSSAWAGGDSANALDKIPSYSLVDLSVRWQATENVSVFAAVDNLFDEEYLTAKFSYDYGYGYVYNSWYPATGRTVRGGLKLSF
jgi:iron complex outermembrane receptor protein